MLPKKLGKSEKMDTSSISQFEERVKSFPDLTKEEEYDLFIEYRKTKSRKRKKEIRDKLVSANLKFVVFVGVKWRDLSCYEDLLQAGSLGLIKSIDKFDPDYDSTANFRTFAFYTILSEMYEVLHKTIFSSKRSEVLFSEIEGESDEGKEQNLLEVMGETSKAEQIINKVAFHNIFDEFCKKFLTRREELVLRLSFGIGVAKYSRREIAPILGLSESFVSKLREIALKKLREEQKRSGIFNEFRRKK